MPEPHTKVFDFADELTSTPRAHLALDLAQDEQGLRLSYEGQPMVECYLTHDGMAAGAFMARALGVRLPKLGESVKARVSTGVLFRAVSIASLDLSIEESMVLLERWLEEADLQRMGTNEMT